MDAYSYYNCKTLNPEPPKTLNPKFYTPLQDMSSLGSIGCAGPQLHRGESRKLCVGLLPSLYLDVFGLERIWCACRWSLKIYICSMLVQSCDSFSCCADSDVVSGLYPEVLHVPPWAHKPEEDFAMVHHTIYQDIRPGTAQRGRAGGRQKAEQSLHRSSRKKEDPGDQGSETEWAPKLILSF